MYEFVNENNIHGFKFTDRGIIIGQCNKDNFLTLKDSDKYFDNKNKKDFLRGIDDIIQLYPKFNNIIIKSDDRIRLTLYDILRGICSKFCEEDIIFYVNDWLGLQVPTNHVRNMRMVENELKIGFGYIPSPYTL